MTETAMTIREQHEQLEVRILSPKAALACKSKGRLCPEPQCMVRTDFQRDRDRIIHSKAFRRLKHKTQVFIDPEEDHFRTRLTHTLEVAQIARTISRALMLNEDLTEAIALGHDLGHTPFGHAGEEALDSMVREYVRTMRFKHSEQSLRVVDLLEKGGAGLNLTHEVRDGILHHSKGRADLSLDTRGPATLEGKVVKISDRVAYINHDIDDAIRAGMLTEDALPEEAVSVLGHSHSQRINTMVVDIIESSRNLTAIGMSERCREATDLLKDCLFERVYGHDMQGSAEIRRASDMLKDLFRFYVDNPSEIKDMAGDGGGTGEVEAEELDLRVRMVSDFISCMTDRYAQKEYTRIFLKWL